MATLAKTRAKYIESIRNREEFKSSTGNLWAQWEGDGKQYVIYSYSTPIGGYEFGAWWVNETKYSVTTTHHQHIVRMAIDS